MITRLLDQAHDGEIALAVVEVLDDLGFNAEEAIPGLIQAVILLAEKTSNPESTLDEAANLLADGPAGDELFS